MEPQPQPVLPVPLLLHVALAQGSYQAVDGALRKVEGLAQLPQTKVRPLVFKDEEQLQAPI